MQLQKARLYNADTGAEVVQFHFNPHELTINKANEWKPKKSSGSNLPDVSFGGGGARTLDMTLTFDTSEQGSDVRVDTDKVLSLMEASQSASATGKEKRPPHVEFGWGAFRSFRAVITKINQKFTLFLADGTPVRATLQVSLQEVPKVAAKKKGQGQNPTSHAAGARKVRVVQPGDTIDWLAADELGDPNLWRVLARANDLDDPRRLRPGQVLVIPSET
jgi:hypothetical protein